VFALVLTSWFAASKARRFKFFALGQQMMLIAFFCLVYQLILFLTDIFLGHHGQVWLLVGSALTTTFLWPWVRIVADNLLLNSK
jgi:rod shape-determining protein MreD